MKYSHRHKKKILKGSAFDSNLPYDKVVGTLPNTEGFLLIQDGLLYINNLYSIDLLPKSTLEKLAANIKTALEAYDSHGIDDEAINREFFRADHARRSIELRRQREARPISLKPTPKATNIYVMLDNHTGKYKIGHSTNPTTRERTLLSQAPDIRLLFSFKGTTDDEKDLHKEFKDKRGRGEWFSLNASDIDMIKTKYTTYEQR